MDALADPVLLRFRAALDQLYGERLKRVVLFGSRARGDAGPKSDYDVAVFLEPMGDRWEETFQLADLRVQFLDETDAFFEARPFPAAPHHGSALMDEIERDGVEL